MSDLRTESPVNDEEILEWGNLLVDDGKDRRKAWEGQWWENLATYVGDFWVEWDVSKRRLREPVRKPRHRSRVPINLAQPVVRTEKAKLTKNRPILDILARSNDKTDLNAAKVADQILNDYVERRFSMPRIRRRMLDWVLICGMGGTFVDWDPSNRGKVRVMVDPSGTPLTDPRVIEGYKNYYKKKKKSPKYAELPQGELRIRPLSPWNILWDYSQLYFEDAMWCIVSEIYDVNEIDRRWGVEVEGDSGAIPGPIEQRLLGKYDLTGKFTFKPTSAQDLREVHRLFVKPGHPYFPNGAEFVFVDDQLIDKSDYPFAHGELPVSMMGHVSLPVSQYGMSVLQQVRAPVIELSKTVSQMIDNRNLMVNPPWLIPKQAKIEKPIQNRPGARIEYQFTPNIPPPGPVQMPEIPQYVKELVPMIKENIDLISGQGETTQGRVPPGARSGVAIAYLQEEDDTRLGPTVQEFEECMEQTGFLILETIAEKYSAPRTVCIYKKHSEPEVFDFMGSQISGNTTVVAQAGSALPRSKAAKQQFMFDMWDRKLEQDPRRVREMLELGEGEPEEFEKDFDQAERENRRMQRGEDVPVLEWHNHPAHHYIHRGFMKSADYEALPSNIQQIFVEHDAEHSRFERKLAEEAAQQQAMMQPPPPGGAGGGTQQNGGPPQQPGAEGQNVPEGAPPQFQGQQTPRSLVNDQPQ